MMGKSFNVHAMPGSAPIGYEAYDSLVSATNHEWYLPLLLTHEDRIRTFDCDALLFVCFDPMILSLYQSGHYNYDRHENLESLIAALRGFLRKDLKLAGRENGDRRIDDASQMLAVFAASFEATQPEVACELRRMSEAVYNRPCEAPEHLKRAFSSASTLCTELAEAHQKTKD